MCEYGSGFSRPRTESEITDERKNGNVNIHI